MKNQFFLMIIFCSISNIAYPMSLILDKASEAKLIAQVKKENVDRKYWPNDVTVSLIQFYKVPLNNGTDTGYFVRAKGSFNGYKVNYDSGTKILYPVKLGRDTQGIFRKEELESLGIQLPE